MRSIQGSPRGSETLGPSLQPMDAMHSAVLSNCLFFNNYGKHDPNISGEVSDHMAHSSARTPAPHCYMHTCNMQ